MRMFYVFRCGLLAAAIALSLVACGSQKTAESPPDVTSPEVTSTDSPATEGTGADEPGPEVDGVSVDLPGAPIGRDDDDDSQPRQCVIASWLADDDVPDGVSVVVTGVRLDPADVFDFSGSSCGGVVGCTESFAYTADHESCSVPISATATDGRSADLRMSAKARCAESYAQRCKDLAANIPEKSIDVTQPDGPADEETDDDTDGDTNGETGEETVEEPPPNEPVPDSTG